MIPVYQAIVRKLYLPAKFAFYPVMVVDEITRIVLNIPNQIRKRHGGLESQKHMDVVFHPIDDDRLMAHVLDDPRDILEHLITPGFEEDILASLHCKDNLNINL